MMAHPSTRAMKIATWNVNSVRARLERLLAWLQKVQPDIICLQELKAREEAFPYEAIREAGYHAAVFGQRTFNGVGILSRIEPQNVLRGMDDGVEDPQARFLAAQVGEIQVVSAYVPNGQVVGSEPYAYKLDWLRRLRAFLEKTLHAPDAPGGLRRLQRRTRRTGRGRSGGLGRDGLVPSDEPGGLGGASVMGAG